MKRPVSQGPNRTALTREDNLPTYEMQNWMNLVADNSVKVQEFTPTLDPSSVSANSTDEQSFTVTGVASDDLVVAVNKPSHTSGVGIAGFRAGSDKVHITFINPTGSPVDPGEEDYLIIVLKR